MQRELLSKPPLCHEMQRTAFVITRRCFFHCSRDAGRNPSGAVWALPLIAVLSLRSSAEAWVRLQHAMSMAPAAWSLHYSQHLSWCNGKTRQTSLDCWARERRARQTRRPRAVACRKAPAHQYCVEETHRPLPERHRRSRPSHKDRPVLSMLVAQHPHPYAVPPPTGSTRNDRHKLFPALRVLPIDISREARVGIETSKLTRWDLRAWPPAQEGSAHV